MFRSILHNKFHISSCWLFIPFKPKAEYKFRRPPCSFIHKSIVETVFNAKVG